MPAPTRRVEPHGGGKAVPVEEQVMQLELPIATAEDPEGAARKAATDLSVQTGGASPKAAVNAERSTPVMMEEVTKRLTEGLHKVAANKGAPGPDGETIAHLQRRWEHAEPKLRTALLRGTYRPGEIRRVHIPKPGGGQRGLGIPNVVDRVVQEAVRQVLEPLYEPTFHPSSHGFRPDRSGHTAITEAKGHVEAGHEWVVDLDLEKFFDRVNHQRLMARLARRVEDRRLLVLIGQMLKAGVVLPDGVVVTTDEGVPQGGPLSPLLSNVVLDELDDELARRGHRFVRYADDVNIFVRSERAGQRVMASVTKFIERRLRLKVNASKSAVARPDKRHFLGFRLKRDAETGVVTILLSERTRDRLMQRIRELTPRNWGGTLRSCIDRLNVYLRGWYGYFGICAENQKHAMLSAEGRLRRRLRAIVLKHWKRKRTIVRNLIARGVRRKTAWRRIYEGRKSLWVLSHDPVVERALPNAYFAERGLVSLVALHRHTHRNIIAPVQLKLGWG
jgi:group II intron reverse transcriptase/maturase